MLSIPLAGLARAWRTSVTGSMSSLPAAGEIRHDGHVLHSTFFQAVHHRDQLLNLYRAIATQEHVFVGSRQERLPDALVEHVHANRFVTEQNSLVFSKGEWHGHEQTLVSNRLGAT